jgi:hypothetical protein
MRTSAILRRAEREVPVTKKLLTSVAIAAFAVACTTSSDPGGSPTTAGSPGRASPSVEAGAPASIELPWLPPQGVVVERNGGVAFVTLDGRVLAKLHGLEPANPTEAPGPILLRDDHAWYALDVDRRQLRRIGRRRADAMHTLDDPAIDLPAPASGMIDRDPAGHWRFALLSPDGDRILAQWSGECEVPTAYVVTLQGGPPVPITGGRPDVPESFALGWSRGGRALVVLPYGPCGSGSGLPGVYAFDASGVAALISTLPANGPGLARMWGSH